jgi:hypothetical protein
MPARRKPLKAGRRNDFDDLLQKLSHTTAHAGKIKLLLYTALGRFYTSFVCILQKLENVISALQLFFRLI